MLAHVVIFTILCLPFFRYINKVMQERNWVTVEGLNLKYEINGKTKDFPGICRASEVPLLVTEDIALGKFYIGFEWERHSRLADRCTIF